MKKLITKKDFILLLVVLVIGVVWILLGNSANKGTTAEIKVDGEIVETISLDGEFLEKEINGVTVCRENGEIYIKEAVCPDKVCVRSGRISKAGEGIICAPNRVAVEIDGKNKNQLDALTG
ncbi:MAG: NusG domain II-containing protein [Clostridia bacterium]|nr:NusG domain II-containing protein [Clostridia bacterium]